MRTDKEYYIRAAKKANRISRLKHSWECVTGWFAMLFVLAILVSPITGCIISVCSNNHPQTGGSSFVIIDQDSSGRTTYNGHHHWSPFIGGY
jgi:hypothetical protein